MNHDLKVLIDRFEVGEYPTEYFIESYRPGPYRFYSAWSGTTKGSKRLSDSMRSREMIAWLEGWFMNQTFISDRESLKALKEGYNARADATAE